MYKLMLVDDEDIVRHQVINKIDWAAYGFEIVCEAENGREALELFELYEPDVIITDIKMPFMDGLELSEAILRDYPYTKIIVLTGFDEFEYAKKGIDLHITNYVLKPVSSKELIKILEEVKEKIDEEIEHKQNVDRLKRHYERSYDVMRHRFMESLLQDRIEEDQVKDWLDYYEIPMKGQRFQVCQIQIDRESSRQTLVKPEDLEYEKIALLDLVYEVDQLFQIGTYFLSNDDVIVMQSFEEEDEQVIANLQMSKLEKLRQACEKFLPFTITIGCGHIIDNLKDLSKSKLSAGNASDYKLAIGANQVIYINDLEQIEQQEFEFSESDQRALRRMIKTGNQGEYNEYVDNSFNLLSQSDESNHTKYVLELFTFLATVAKELGVSVDEVVTKDESILRMLQPNEPLEFKMNKVKAYGRILMEGLTSKREQSTSTLVQEAKKFAETHYKDWEINIEQISEYLHYSPNYFSSMFKKETGIAFMNYLSSLRIEKAKELLVTTDMKNFEIAMEVGFSSANYFSFCFKKEVTLSPTNYRKTYTTESE